MKFITSLASLAAFIPAIMAVDPRFPDTGPFKMMALAYETPIHYSYIRAKDGYLTFSLTSDSSCGTREAIFDGGNGNLTMYSKDAPVQQGRN